VRAAVAPAARLRPAGQTCYRGVATMELATEHRTTCRETWGGRVRFGYSALDGNRVYWFAPLTAPPGGAREESPRATLAPLLAGFPAPIPAILEATPDETISRLDLHDLEPLPRWHDRRIALLGDAAHATTPNLGQGGAQAIEDAWVLARCLADEPSPATALAEYERIRRPRVSWIVAAARRMGAVAHWESPLARAVRDLAVRTTPAAVTDRTFARLFTPDA
jgi:2-polyprenyl-6-methoxyphenol hydroxylase-like FAD-dependent oxidoreductase